MHRAGRDIAADGDDGVGAAVGQAALDDERTGDHEGRHHVEVAPHHEVAVVEERLADLLVAGQRTVRTGVVA
ncbi:hypothetical protein ACFYY1_34320 [Streptomyces sp. NPDC001890]|uniref:hypothetical protein n=1 Tax=Streptomyces sp. NPDC001890 TaxID=3364620 RepID=UPI0036B76F72